MPGLCERLLGGAESRGGMQEGEMGEREGCVRLENPPEERSRRSALQRVRAGLTTGNAPPREASPFHSEGPQTAAGATDRPWPTRAVEAVESARRASDAVEEVAAAHSVVWSGRH